MLLSSCSVSQVLQVGVAAPRVLQCRPGGSCLALACLQYAPVAGSLEVMGVMLCVSAAGNAASFMVEG